MARGGARNRSGPPPSPDSQRSERRGLSFVSLPASGFVGKVPDLSRFLPVVTARHEAIWSDIWSTPQACAWEREPWRWPIVADLVEHRVRMDDPQAPAALATAVRQLRDDLGLSAAGLRANGWVIAHDEVGEKRSSRTVSRRQSSRERLRVVSGDG